MELSVALRRDHKVGHGLHVIIKDTARDATWLLYFKIGGDS